MLVPGPSNSTIFAKGNPQANGAFKASWSLVNQEKAAQMFKNLIRPLCNCCSSVWDGLSQQLSDKLQKKRKKNRTALHKYTKHLALIPLLSYSWYSWIGQCLSRTEQKTVITFKTLNNQTLIICRIYSLVAKRCTIPEFREHNAGIQPKNRLSEAQFWILRLGTNFHLS